MSFQLEKRLVASAHTEPTTLRACTGPDFICAGMQKAGTQWLYDQLQFHPEFWMPPVKELHFFDRSEPKPDAHGRRIFVGSLDAENARRHKRKLRLLDERDRRFFS